MAIPIGRIREKLDFYFSENNIKQAERLLDYWYREAEYENDIHALFFISNEFIGFYRQLREKEKAYFYCEKALSLSEHPHIKNTEAQSDACINAATAFSAFSEHTKAVKLFEKAEKIYTGVLDKNDVKFAYLYNNKAETLSELGKAEEALALFDKAASVLKSSKNSEPELAITYLNKADALQKGNPENLREQTVFLLEKAREVLESVKDDKSARYANSCRKCAQAFRNHGYAKYSEELSERAEKIYERN